MKFHNSKVLSSLCESIVLSFSDLVMWTEFTTKIEKEGSTCYTTGIKTEMQITDQQA